MDNLAAIAGTFATTKAGLTAGTTTTYTTANTVQFCIRGKSYSKTAVANGATPTTDATTGSAFSAIPAGSGSVFVFGFDKDGNIKVSQGSVETLDGSTTTGATAKFSRAPQFPVVPDTVCAFGYATVLVGSAASAWTFGASNLAGPPSSVGINFVDCLTLPDRPQVA
jgi:hypothetical protein